MQPLDPSLPACDTFHGCGGDLAGEWELRHYCIGSGTLIDEPCVTVRIEGVSISGNVTFQGNQLVNDSQTALLVYYEYPIDCLGDRAAEFCPELQAALTSSAQDVGEGSVACALSPTSCSCQLVQLQELNVDGTWTSEDDSLDITYDNVFQMGPITGQAQYCVDGDVLMVRSVDPASGIEATTILTRN